MTASTEQERQEFLDQVGHLIADGTIETRSLKRAGISFACGNLHAAFLAWKAARRAPVVPKRKQIEQYLYEQDVVTVPRKVAAAAGLARLTGQMQSAPVVAVPQAQCVICGSDEPYAGTCGSNDPRALCKKPAPHPPEVQP